MRDALIGAVVGVMSILFILLVVIDIDNIWHNKIVKAGHGEYNRTTGEFQFLPIGDRE
jgi:hypothetical protein